MVQVMEFADLGVAAGQQLGVKPGGNGLELRGRYAQGHGVHAFAPAPEVIALRAALLGQTGHGALESVAVGVDQAG